jgi:hypothetical protein
MSNQKFTSRADVEHIGLLHKAYSVLGSQPNRFNGNNLKPSVTLVANEKEEGEKKLM